MRKFLNVGWSVGAYCNAKCAQCYSRSFRQNRQIMTVDEIDTILNKLSKYGIKTINFGGNEPIFTDGKDISKTKLPYIIKKANELGFLIGITTNGTTANYLYDHTDCFDLVDDWDISFDSIIPNEHNINRGSDIYENAISAINKIIKKEKSASIIYCLMNWNCSKQHAKKLSEFCKQYNFDLRVNTLKPTSKEHFELLPTNEQIKCFFQEIGEHFDLVSSSDVCVSINLPNPKLKKCLCGYHSFSIGAKKENGKIPISPCVYMQDFATGDIITQDIENIINNSSIFNRIKDRYENGATECKNLNCKYINICGGGCMAYAYLTKGDIMNADNRCGILDKNNIALLESETLTFNNKVHENYLCTYIGRLKK